MRGLMVVLERLGAVSGILVALGCAQDAGPRARGLRTLDPPGAPMGAAVQRANRSAWKVIQGADFNLDGMADVLWNDPEQNLMAVWLMDGTRLLAPGPVIPGPLGDGWIAASAADFNLDGMADVLWNDPEQNLMAVWLMDGTRLLAPGPVIPGPLGGGWVAVQNLFDLNRDNMADVVWNNPERNLMAVWLMEGTRLLAPGPFIPGPAGDGWKAVAIGDANFDGMGDVVWNNPEQNLMAVWLMEGSQLLAPGPVIPGPLGDGWIVVTANDFSGDGEADVLWTNGEQGLMAIWLMDGSRLLAPGPVIPGPLGEGWAVRTAGDTNFDSLADAIWQADGTNLMAVWLMEGSRLLAPGPVIPGPPDGG
ncbi:VCBS repeat-containing protein [Sorangium sp. So ce296]|uniref:FG-GAP repeat domain-containing protein n=1 Tax=Sorangium sp. So ce296 TaxID=3133296 RepID=UPI003F647871